MSNLLKPSDVMDKLGGSRKTAITMMWQMNPIILSGTVRKTIRVREEDFLNFILKKQMKPTRPVSGSGRKLARR